MRNYFFGAIALLFTICLVSCEADHYVNADISIEPETQFLELMSQYSTEGLENISVTKVSEVNHSSSKMMKKYLLGKKSNSELGVIINTNSERGILQLYAISIDNENEDGHETVVVNVTDEFGTDVLKEITMKINNYGNYEIVNVKHLDDSGAKINRCDYSDSAPAKSEPEPKSRFQTCIGCALDTDNGPGQVIAGLGIASSLGCVPCAGILGFISVVTVVGCAGS